MGRREAREELFKIVFEADQKCEEVKKIYKEVLERDGIEFSLADKELIEVYSCGISERVNEIEEVIESNMKNWKIDRLGSVERVLLKIAVYEILENEKDYKIAINEAVELAKIYGEDKSFEFINGVLANVVKK